MKKYKSYKPSGIEWLETIPENWNISKLKYLGDLFGGLTGKKGDDFNNDENPKNKPYIPYTNIFNNTYISKNHFHYVSINENENQNRVKKFDLFFLMSSETHKDLGKSCVLIDEVDELYLNSFCKGYRIKDKNIHPLFLNYQILGHLHREKISIEGKGFTRINLRQDKINDLVVFFPSYNEQEQIVKYLDKKTSIIDKLLSTKERKIELLKEKRISLINHVITKGLNPNVIMKDSDVKWIGEIPKHWEMKKLKYIFQIQKRISGELGHNVLSITQKGIKLKDIESGKGQVSMDYRKYQIVEVGDFGMNHMDLLTGYIDISPYKGVTSPDYRVFTRTDEKSNSKYYLYLFQFGYSNKVFYGFGQGSSMFGRWRLPSREFNNFKIPYPSLEEQNKIVSYLDNQMKEIDDLVSMELKKIELLKEYRQSLISEVITGKIKVVE